MVAAHRAAFLSFVPKNVPMRCMAIGGSEVIMLFVIHLLVKKSACSAEFTQK